LVEQRQIWLAANYPPE
jgi:hypothetical protein